MDYLNYKIAGFLYNMGIDKDNLSWGTRIILLAGVLLVAYIFTKVFHYFIMPAIHKITAKTKATWDDILFDHSVMVHLSRMVAPVIIYLCIPIAFAGSTAMAFVQRLCLIYIIVTFLSLLDLIKHRVITYTIDEDEMIWIIKGEDMYETAAGH